MNKYMILYFIIDNIVFKNCLSCHLDQIMINGSKWSDSKIFQQFMKFQTFDYDFKFHNLSEINSELNQISITYSNITKVFSLGKTTENRDIPAVIVSNNKFKGNVVVFECGTHAREWISVSFCLWSINKLLEDRTLLDSYQFLIIPVLNSDGYVFSWEYHRFWRKNRAQLKETKCNGIDINRNWDTNEFCVHKAVNESCDESYCGETPFSSAEAKALSKYLLANREDIFAYFSIHSFNQLWMYPWANKNETVPNSLLLEELAEIGVKAIHRVFGTEYKYGPFSQVMYPASGVSIDWVYDTLKVDIVFAIELRDQGEYGFLLPCYLIKAVCQETWAGIEAVLKHLTSYQLKTDSSHHLSLHSLVAISSLLIFLRI